MDYLPLDNLIIQNAYAQSDPAPTVSPVIKANPVDNEDNNKLSLIAILVEESLMSDQAIKSRVMDYAKNAQERVPHSKSFVLEVKKDESTFKIASMLEKLYFEGVDTDLIDTNPLNNNSKREDDNRLIGTVLIGDIPMPVVHESEGLANPSIYPYIDFYRKAYIYNHEAERFEVNQAAGAPTPEIWHGLISPPSHDKQTAKDQLIEYFDKNNKYSKGDENFTDFEQRMMYANYPEMEKQMNFIDYSNYNRYIKFMEEIIFSRFNKHLLKELLKDVSISLGTPDTPIMTDESINNFFDIHTEQFFSKYTTNFAEALKNYRSGINGEIKKTGRWTSSEVDTPESLIAIRDEYAKYDIRAKQLALEQEINEFIEDSLTPQDKQSDVITLARLNIKLRISDQDAGEKTFTFTSYIDGERVSQIDSSKQCGIQLGQERGANDKVLENNSLAIHANQMYNPETLLQPPSGADDWKLVETASYKKFAGCVFNNSIKNDQTGADPKKCLPKDVTQSIFDIVGSVEIEKGKAVTTASNRCDTSKMSFRLFDDEQFNTVAAGSSVLGIGISKNLDEVIETVYGAYQGNLPNPSIQDKATFVIQELLSAGSSYTYEPLDTVEIEVSVLPESKKIDSVMTHVEPTKETIDIITHANTPRINPTTGELNIPPIITPSTPADGIRSISFNRNGQSVNYEYPNLFRIEGENKNKIERNIIQKLSSKQNELTALLDENKQTIEKFYLSNLDVKEPLVWKAMSIDQKLASISSKYLDRDSLMPSPKYSVQKSPQNKPKGYEVLHVVANGDSQGYQFGLNRAMIAQAPEISGSIDGGSGTGGLDPNDESNSGGGGLSDEGNFICGDPSGVEIWEWFDALQCWIDEEILPAEELFAVTNVCSAADIPNPNEIEEEGDIFDQLLTTAEKFSVEMKRKDLVPNQEQVIKVSALTANNEPILGFIDMPVKFELENESLGEFSTKETYIFTGDTEVTFTAKKIGNSKLTVTMGNLAPQTLTIHVHEKIQMKWQTSETIKNGRSEFVVKVNLTDQNDKPLTGFNDSVSLGVLQPADGGFQSGGKIKLNVGQGEIGFIPAPGKQTVTLISKDPNIQASHDIHPKGPSATQIILRAPPYMPIGEVSEIEVIAADSFGYPGKSFNQTIDLSLDDESKKYAELLSGQVKMISGKGLVKIQAGKESADIKIQASHKDLSKTEINTSLLARVDSESWKETYPQNLFASFVGFPAGNYLEENYFGGTHLFAGKTQAVYSFLNAPNPEPIFSIEPNHLVHLGNSSQEVLVNFPDNDFLLQIIDKKKVQTLASKKVAMNFTTVEKLSDEFETGKIYLEILDNNHRLAKKDTGYQIKDSFGEVVANIQANKINILDSEFHWEYNLQPDFNAVELTLTNNFVYPVRVILNFEKTTIEADDFQEINPGIQSQKTFGGISTQDPTGLLFFDPTVEISEESRDEFYGISGDQKYISLFASGTSIGEATKFKMPANAILLGDPTIKLKSRSLSSLNFNNATGQQIYEDPDGSQIKSINHFNFNNDEYDDIALITEDGKVRLLEGGPTEPPYIDQGNIAFLADGGIALETFDFKNDNYEDLLVATDEGRLAILQNDAELITRTDHKLNIGKKLYKLLKNDMDQDGFDDLVVHDSRGDILIFYYDGENQKFPESGKWIGNYGYSITDENQQVAIDIRYQGMPEPNEAEAPITPLGGFNGGGKVDDDTALEFWNQQNAAAEAGRDNPTQAAGNTVEKLPWQEGDEIETYFEPIENIGGLKVTKSLENLDRPGAKNVDLEETLRFTIEVESDATYNNVVLADTVLDSLALVKGSVNCVEGACENMRLKQNSIRLFLSELNLKPGQKTTITYDVFVAHTPASGIMIHTIDEANENLASPTSIVDNYVDVLVSPPNNNTGRLLYHYSTDARSYEITNDNAPVQKQDEGNEAYTKLMSQMQRIATSDADNPPDPLILEGMGDALNKATGGGSCFDDPNSSVTCAEGALDDIAGAINDFACMGGGCFPMPYNYAFMVPPQSPTPILAFPSTLPTPAGPMPMLSSVFFPLPGMSNIPGPIMSMLRFYLSPTLTGGIGLAMCWGPYPQSPIVPPPVFPVPYPPPIGNCMVTALPVDSLFGNTCSNIQDGISKTMDLIAAGVNKIDSSVNDINNNSNLPVNISQSSGGNGGGLEVGLAINLGNSTKFEPSFKTFSNTHITSFDSIGGAISGWIDKQTLEIQNKLLTLPTFTVLLPDVRTLVSLDWEKTEKRFGQWKNVLSGSTAETGEKLKKLSEVQQGSQVVEGSKVLQYTEAIETQASIYNLSAIEGLYDVASTLPLVKLTEKPITFEIPWLSTAEISAFIGELQNWLLYYEREYDRVKDKWDKFNCSTDGDEIKDGEYWKATGECQARNLADLFGTNFDELEESVQENIEVLQSYLDFPKKLVKFKMQLADYIRNVACYLDVIAQMMGGWLATIQQQMISWVEVILTIKAIVENLSELFDVFTNFDSNCDICTNERYANFGWWSILGLILPDIPIIEFPKIPNVVFDMSKIDIALDIELPILKFRTKPIPLPPLPYITLPDLPTLSLFLSLPPLPILPRLPDLPDLPPLPPIPVIDLPTLPPPPKLPDLGKTFEVVIPLIEKILNTWCIMKKALAPVPEMMLNDEITLITNRPAYLIPLDLLEVKLPNVALFDLGFNEIRIETMIYLGLKLNIVAEPIEKWVEDINNKTDAIPEAMNRFYADRIIELEEQVQAELDKVGEKLDDLVAGLEKEWDEHVQGWLDEKVGDPLEEVDKWARDREAAWQEWSDEQEIDFGFDQYIRGVNSINDKINKWKGTAASDIDAWFAKNSTWISWVSPAAKLFEYIDDQSVGDETQEILEFTAEKLNQFESLGPTVLQRLYSCVRYWGDCKENEQRYFGDTQANATEVISDKPKEVIAHNPIQPVTSSHAEEANRMLGTPEGQQIKNLVVQMTQAISDVNEKEFVDYEVLKEKFGVDDYIPLPKKTSVDKLRFMQTKLLEQSEKIMAEAQGIKHINDLSAIAGIPPQSSLPYELASEVQQVENNEIKTFTNALPISKNQEPGILEELKEQKIELDEKVERQAKQTQATTGSPHTRSCAAAVCLPDLITGDPVNVIPYIDFYATSETLFMPLGHVVYSDGTGLYLKRDLTIDDTDTNTDNGSPKSFKLDDNFLSTLRMESKPKEAVNMLQTAFTENGAATFSWQESSRKDIYGYGIELERSISGYDAFSQNRQLADTKIILLPADENGNTPKVYVNGELIPYGTLATSLKNEEEAGKRFGVNPRSIVSSASEVHFPTINNAKINVSDYKAVYFDQLDGAAYSMEMENGFHHIKMTWFDENARTATYNQNEILAPQIYAGASEPVDVSQSDTYYLPLFKNKTIKASDIFVDLSGSYNFYWFIDPENNKLTPVIGDKLTLPPQEEEKTIKVKLVATQDIQDDSFERFEKTFQVNIYAPEVSLDEEKLQEGIIAGNMTPVPGAEENDLSDVPFSVFRKRLGTWKNIGILRDQDPEKSATQPPLNDHTGKDFVYEDSYYSTGADGNYEITGFELIEPSSILMKDHTGKEVAEVEAKNGQINLADDSYDLVAVPAGISSPTHIAIIEKESQGIVGNVYYVSDSKENISNLEGPLTLNNVASSGTTVGDANPGDDIIAAQIPSEGPSFPGGVAIFNETPPQNNVALVDKDGTIRMMQAGYNLKLKNKNTTNGKYIFQIVDAGGKAVYDIFIQANWDNLQIDNETNMNDLGVQIGLNTKPETAFAQSTPQEELKVESSSNAPFSDLDESHPFFKQILDLYEARVVSGYDDGSFKPDQKLTRAEFVKIALGVTNCYDCTQPTDPQIARYLNNPFPDVSLPAWYFYCISIAKELGMITGYGDGLFRPEQNISRAEAAAVLIRQSDIELTKAPEQAYRDVPDYAWYVDYVHTAVEIGLIKESFGFVNPDEEITRGEFAFMAAGLKDYRQCRLVDEDGDSVPDWWEMTHNTDPLVPDLFRSCPCTDNPNQNDTDGDGVRDVCDLDIDNDGILNPLCIFDDTGQPDQALIDAGLIGFGEAIDNCIFNVNEDQADYDTNGIGNICEVDLSCECSDNPNQNDTDGDGIRDVCDNDIDNDTVLNPICIFDDSGLLDAGLIKEKAKDLAGPLDNCIFDQNTEQKDVDGNTIGNVCEESNLCPQVPEDIDGVDDEDGCPELNDSFPSKDPGIYVGRGELCGFLDFTSDFVPGDTFMTAITDIETHEVLISSSPELTYK